MTTRAGCISRKGVAILREGDGVVRLLHSMHGLQHGPVDFISIPSYGQQE
jgi:hypothetical protein